MATYKEIQEYVKSTHGFLPKTCWIAHVKEMCGLQPGTAPNRTSAAIRENPCPTSKVQPIEQAFRHFGMI